jgi:hypothetical protein
MNVREWPTFLFKVINGIRILAMVELMVPSNVNYVRKL